MPHEAVESPLVYTRCRDIHSVGVILLQMLMGSDVMERFPDVHTALRNCERVGTVYKLTTRLKLLEQPPYRHTYSSKPLTCSRRARSTPFRPLAFSPTCRAARSLPSPCAAPPYPSQVHFSCIHAGRRLLRKSVGTARTPGPKTPMWHPNINGSPETDYFLVPPPRAKHASRWKEDWEELELLVRCFS